MTEPTTPPSDSSEKSYTELRLEQIRAEPRGHPKTGKPLSRLEENIRSITHPKKPGGLNRFQPGQPSNGRPKGSKNKITLLKQVIEAELRERAAGKIVKVLDKAFQMAIEGDRLMIKLLLELHMSKGAHQDDNSSGKSQVAVVVQNLTAPAVEPSVEVIDVTPQIEDKSNA
jgi:hypothetical protein